MFESKKSNKEGIKHDEGKLCIADMTADFKDSLEELCKVWTYGAKTYGKSNWKKVNNAKARYTNALMRHLMDEFENDYDSETNLLHAAHIAWNALARLHFILEEKKALHEQCKKDALSPCPKEPEYTQIQLHLIFPEEEE